MKLIFINKTRVARDTYKFSFKKPEGFKYLAGQFFELSIEHDHPDDRGYRRWFTISSSPTEKKLSITTKIIEKRSSFKSALNNLKPGSAITASKAEGDFVLPKEDSSVVWIAGGIGITPFRSQLKYLLDKNINDYEITLFYSNKTKADIYSGKLLKKATTQLKRFKLILTLTENNTPDWRGEVGTIDQKMISQGVGNIANKFFYVSGPQLMVDAYRGLLLDMGVGEDFIKVDRFPGYKETN